MSQTIHRGIKALIDQANAEIETVSAADAIKIANNGDVGIVASAAGREIGRCCVQSRGLALLCRGQRAALRHQVDRLAARLQRAHFARQQRRLDDS